MHSLARATVDVTLHERMNPSSIGDTRLHVCAFHANLCVTFLEAYPVRMANLPLDDFVLSAVRVGLLNNVNHAISFELFFTEDWLILRYHLIVAAVIGW